MMSSKGSVRSPDPEIPRSQRCPNPPPSRSWVLDCLVLLLPVVVEIILNPAVGRGGACGFWGAGQGATTRNGATPQQDADAMNAVAASPALPDPRCGGPRATLRGAPFQGVANNAAMHRKNYAICSVADSPER